MNIFKLMHRIMAPLGDDKAGGGAAEDRGDDFVATTEEEDEAAAEAAKAEAAKKAEKAVEDLGAETEEAKAAAEAAATAAAAAADKDKDKGKKDTRIPLNRHTEILNKERERSAALEAQLAAVTASKEATATTAKITELEASITDKEAKYAELLAEGKIKEATAMMVEIRATERTITQQRVQSEAAAATATAVEQVRYEAVIERLYAAYPQLNTKSEEYDDETTKEVAEMMQAFEARGMSSSAALQKAVGYVMPAKTVKQEDAVKVVPRVNAEAAAAAAAEAAKTERETEARKRNAAAQGKQPPALGDAGANSDAAGGILDAKTAIKMPYEKFSKLGEEELSRMRGDTI